MIHSVKSLLLFALVGLLYACQQSPVENQAAPDYLFQSTEIKNVKLTDDFWLPILERIRTTTIPYALEKCYEEGRFENFLIAGGQMEGETRGAMPFDDSDPYKIIEGASLSLISHPDPKLEVLLDSLIAIIAVGQEEDGYITTWRTINPAKPPAPWVDVKKGERWDALNQSHELYNPGHMYEAAAAHYRATGKRNFLDIALKNADFVVKTFGDGPGQICAVPGHQIIETGLVQLYRITGKKEYLDQAKYFLDNRGNKDKRELHGQYIGDSYTQDHVHPTLQDEALGHSVRAVYMYAGMTDIAALYGDSAYQKASEKLWENTTYKKTYITGGIGSRKHGEAFGDNYELPNKTGYQETCAAIGSVCWNHRLFLQTGKVEYYDVIERTLYNGLISGLSLDGTQFFYPNTLESDAEYKFNRGACTRQSWFDCSCCPTNLIRFLPSLPRYIYSSRKDTVYANLFMSNTSTVDTENNQLAISTETQYPWEGRVTMNVKSENDNEVLLKVRIPGWVRGEVLPGDLYSYTSSDFASPVISINGTPVASPEIQEGYLLLSENWKEGVKVQIDFPMNVKMAVTSEKVPENKNMVALEYGPIVYAVEEIDNPTIDEIGFDSSEAFAVQMQPELLGGVNTLTTDSYTAIPYYTWSNRGIGKMKVWLDEK